MVSSSRGDFQLCLSGLVEVMSEFLKLLIYFCCASIFMGYLCIQTHIDVLVSKQRFLLLTVLEITLHTRQG